MITALADGDVANAAGFRDVVARMLRGLSGDALRRLAASWPTEGEVCDLIIAEAIAEALDERSAADGPARQGRSPWLGRQALRTPERAAA